MNIRDKKYTLINKEKDLSTIFKTSWLFVKSFLNKLWKQPYIIYQLLSLSNISDIKNNLAPFFANNFYDNILSSHYFGDNLIYIISLLLKEEINNLSNLNNPESFLENTPCGIFLEQLCDKCDIKSFCKLNILNIIENLESTFSSKIICFDTDGIQNYFKKNKNMFKKPLTNDFEREEEIMREEKNSEEIKIFNSNYLIDLKIKILENFITKYENENNYNMKEYINYQIDESKKEIDKFNESENKNLFGNIKNKKEIYGNENFIDNLFELEHSDNLFSIYITSFLKTVELINLLFKNLALNSHLLPYSIKCICKIILNLIIKKFPNINKAQQIAFMSRFFFDKLFLPILKNPSLKALISEYIISDETIKNLNLISIIISKLCSGKLYYYYEENGNYTPFNRFFIEKMPEVFSFFEEILKVDIPKFVTKLIDDKLEKNFRPSYFEDYPHEIIFHRSIFFNINDLYLVIQNMKKYKEKIFVDEKTKIIEAIFNKITQKNYFEIIESIKQTKLYENKDNFKNDKNKGNKKKNKDEKKEIKKEINNYYLITKIKTNKEYSYIFKMNQEKEYLNKKEFKKVETEEEIMNNNLIKIKNLICQILYNFHILKNSDFNQESIINSSKIFKELKKYIKLSDYIIDETIPNEWYINTLLQYFNKIPKKYQDNDYELLYEEIGKDINSSLQLLSFDILGLFLDKIKFAEKNKTFYQKEEKSLIDLSLNEKAQAIIQYMEIPCELYFCYNDKEKKISLMEKKEDKSLEFLDSMILKEPPKNTKISKTINSFTKIFPNIVKISLFHKENNKIFQILKEMDIPKIIEKYLNIVKNKIYNFNIWKTEEEFYEINNKIYDFVTEKIYHKIYPLKPSIKDNDIYENSLKLYWTEPRNYIKDKANYSFDSFLPNIIYDFKQLHKKKSPRKKIIVMRDIFNCINNLVKLNGDDENIDIDQQISILIYAFIKAQPSNIETDCNFIELFIEKDGENESLLSQLKIISKFVDEIKYTNLIGVSKEEFDEKFVKNKDFIIDINE